MAHASIGWVFGLSLFVVGMGGCSDTRECKKGTLLIEAHYPSGVDRITVDVSLDGGAQSSGVLNNPSGATVGTAEVDFTTYPVGATVTVHLRAFMGSTVIAGKSSPIVLRESCSTLSITLDDSELDGSVDGLPGDDLSTPSCESGKHYCGGSILACVDDTSIVACGPDCMTCPAPMHGTATCTPTGCSASCDTGFITSGTTCDIAAPRPIFPSSNSYTSDRMPTFVWALAADTNGAHLDVCSDRACTNVILAVDVMGTSYDPVADLNATGTLFWRLAGHSSVVDMNGTLFSPVWEFQPLKRAAISVKTAFSRLSDINNDGYADVVIGDDEAYPVVATNKGVFYVHYGSSTGAATMSTTTVVGGIVPGGFARTVALLGDVNGDGFSDLLVGSYGEGKAYFYRGAQAGLVTASPTVLASAATSPNMEFGAKVAAAGDLNGDGYADAVVGATSVTNGAYVFYGGPSGLPTVPSITLTIPAGSTWFGHSVAGAGDVNRDGYADLIVGDPGADKVYLYLGGPSGVAAIADQTIASPVAAGQFFGLAIGSVGDANGDGYADIVATSQSSKRAWVFKGIPTGINGTFVSELPTAAGPTSYGQSAEGIGDFNGDGYADLVVTTLNSTTQAIYLGSAGGIVVSGNAVTAPSNAGSQGAGAGDLNGDGFSDLIIGAPSSGVVGIYNGTAGTMPTTYTTTLGDTGTTGRYGISVQ